MNAVSGRSGALLDFPPHITHVEGAEIGPGEVLPAQAVDGAIVGNGDAHLVCQRQQGAVEVFQFGHAALALEHVLPHAAEGHLLEVCLEDAAGEQARQAGGSPKRAPGRQAALELLVETGGANDPDALVNGAAEDVLVEVQVADLAVVGPEQGGDRIGEVDHKLAVGGIPEVPGHQRFMPPAEDARQGLQFDLEAVIERAQDDGAAGLVADDARFVHPGVVGDDAESGMREVLRQDVFSSDAVLNADHDGAVADFIFDLPGGFFEVVELDAQDDDIGVGHLVQAADHFDGDLLFLVRLAARVKRHALFAEDFRGFAPGQQPGVGVVQSGQRAHRAADRANAQEYDLQVVRILREKVHFSISKERRGYGEGCKFKGHEGRSCDRRHLTLARTSHLRPWHLQLGQVCTERSAVQVGP